MSENKKVVCPKCGSSISIDDVLHDQIEKNIRDEYEAKHLTEIENIKKREADLIKQTEELELFKSNTNELIEKSVKDKLAKREIEIHIKAKQDAENDQKQKTDSIQLQLDETVKKLSQARSEQTKLMDEKRKLEDERELFEIEKRKQIEEAILPIKEKENQLRKEIEEFKTAIRNNDELIEKSVKDKVAERETEIRNKVRQDAENDQKQKIDSIQKQLDESLSRLSESRLEQVKLMDEKRKLEDDKEAFEIEKRKQIDEAIKKIREEADKKASEEYKNLILQKDKQLADVVQLNNELKRKAEQGSQQTQGEMAELNLEETLKDAFIYDEIKPVPKGTSGADVIQIVKNTSGKSCGQIIWEVKNTKAWSEGWIQKLKDDQREIKADVAIIISSVLPEGIKAFDIYNGIWVCDINLAIPLARVVRDKLEAITREKGLAVGKNEKMDILYQYLTGVQFKQRIEAIVETFNSMNDDLVKEKQYYTKKWAKTEKQIQKVIDNTVGMYGDLEGMVSLPKIQSLELEYLNKDEA